MYIDIYAYMYMLLSICLYVDAFETCGGQPRPSKDRGSIKDLFKSGSLIKYVMPNTSSLSTIQPEGWKAGKLKGWRAGRLEG